MNDNCVKKINRNAFRYLPCETSTEPAAICGQSILFARPNSVTKTGIYEGN